MFRVKKNAETISRGFPIILSKQVVVKLDEYVNEENRITVWTELKVVQGWCHRQLNDFSVTRVKKLQKSFEN